MGFEPADPHLGKVVFSVLEVASSPLQCCSVHPVSSLSTVSRPCSRAVYFRSVSPTRERSRERLGRARSFSKGDTQRPTWIVNAYRKQSSEEDLGFRIELRWHQLDRRHRFRKRHPVDGGPMQRHHLTKVTVMKGVYGM